MKNIRLVIVLLVLGLTACDGSPLERVEETTDPWLYPTGFQARFLAGDTVTVSAEPAQRDWPLAVLGRPDGRFLLASGSTVWLYEPTGERLWQRSLFEANACGVRSVDQGFAFLCSTPEGDLHVVRVDQAGERVGATTFQTGEGLFLAVMTKDGGALAGNALGSRPQKVVKFGADGREQWTHVFAEQQSIGAFVEREDGGVLLAGGEGRALVPGPGVVDKGLILALDPQGEAVWSTVFDACPLDCSFSHIIALRGSRFLLLGVKFVPVAENEWSGRPWRVLIDADGNTVWDVVDQGEAASATGRLDLFKEAAEGFVMVTTGSGESRRGATLHFGADGRLLRAYDWPFSFDCGVLRLIETDDEHLAALLQCENLAGRPGAYTGEVWTELIVLE